LGKRYSNELREWSEQGPLVEPVGAIEIGMFGVMKAVVCTAWGPIEGLVIEDRESPDAGPGDVKIALRARGVSYTDVLKIAGTYQVKTEPPFIPGGEASGEIIGLGPEVEGLAVGDRVLCGGGFAEETVQPADTVVRLPPDVDFRTAAAFRSNYMTAYYGLMRGRLQPGETLLVHGAAGGVGLAAVDMGKLMGATVIATARNQERLDVCKNIGADHVVDYSDGFREQVKELTAGRGADVIYDPVGGDVFDESMRCVAPLGRILIVGFTGGRPALAKTNHLLVKDAEVIGYTIGGLMRHSPEQAERLLQQLIGWLAAGRISPYYSHELPLAQAVAALKLIENREVMGKALLV
jgi:NADPH:quinone reductase